MIEQGLINSGLLQLGYFDDGIPYRLRLEMLSAYPQLLNAIADVAAKQAAALRIDRLLAAPDCVPLASVISQKTGLSLVYSRGTDEQAVFDLVGAYDVGHPTCLLINTWDDAVEGLIEKAAKGGLDVIMTLILMETKTPATNRRFQAIMQLSKVVDTLAQNGLIPVGQARSVVNQLAL